MSYKLISTLVLFLSLSLNGNTQERYRVVKEEISQKGIHQLQEQLYNGLPVFNLQLKINQYDHQIFKHISTIEYEDYSILNTIKNFTILHSDSGYLYLNQAYKSVIQQEIRLDNGEHHCIFIDKDNQIIAGYFYHSMKTDTLINGTVFFPNPITSAQVSYGSPYADNSDATNAALDAELYPIQTIASWENDTFYLSNQHLTITNFSLPDIPVTKLITSNFSFTRNKQGFEEINAMFHITRFASYIKDSLGFSNLANYSIEVDVYGKSGEDNSEFIPNTTPPRLNFGQGGVDDAEDADILIHEYSHALTNSASPGTLFGSERVSIEEAYCDYFAASYSKDISQYEYKKLFNWDGHNEFWNGRSIDNSFVYPTDLPGEKYANSTLFSAALIEIRDHIPDTAADRIILESTYNTFSNMDMRDAASYLFIADTALYNGLFSPTIQWILCKRGLSIVDCENKISREEIGFKNLSINFQLLQSNQLQLYSLPNTSAVKIFDLEGKLLFIQSNWNNEPIPIGNLAKGHYILQLNHQYNLRFVK